MVYTDDYVLEHVLSLMKYALYIKYDQEGSRTLIWLFTTSEDIENIAISSGFTIKKESPQYPDVEYFMIPRYPEEPINLSLGHMYGYGVRGLLLLVHRGHDAKRGLEASIERYELKKKGVPTSMVETFAYTFFGRRPTTGAVERELANAARNKLQDGVFMKYVLMVDVPIVVRGWSVKRLKKDRREITDILNGEIDKFFKGLRRRWGIASLSELTSMLRFPPYAKPEFRPVTMIKGSKITKMEGIPSGIIKIEGYKEGGDESDEGNMDIQRS